jgi:hypothetical protein
MKTNESKKNQEKPNKAKMSRRMKKNVRPCNLSVFRAIPQ